MNRRERDARKPKFQTKGPWPRAEKAPSDHDHNVLRRLGADRERDERRKRQQKAASLMGQAGALEVQADKARASARIPYQVVKQGERVVGGVCSVCEQPVGLTPGGSLQPHTPSTCPGPAARVRMT